MREARERQGFPPVILLQLSSSAGRLHPPASWRWLESQSTLMPVKRYHFADALPGGPSSERPLLSRASFDCRCHQSLILARRRPHCDHRTQTRRSAAGSVFGVGRRQSANSGRHPIPCFCGTDASAARTALAQQRSSLSARCVAPPMLSGLNLLQGRSWLEC